MRQLIAITKKKKKKTHVGSDLSHLPPKVLASKEKATITPSLPLPHPPVHTDNNVSIHTALNLI